MQNGFLVNDLGFRVDRDVSGYYVDVRITNPVQEKERYLVTGGKHGSYRFNLTFDSIPHNFSGGTLLFTGAGTGRLHIADSVQSALQAAEQTRLERGGDPRGDTTGEDAIAQGIVRGLYAEANAHVFRLKRKTTGFSLDYNVTDSVRTWFMGSNEKRTGTRLSAAGTYERFAQGAAGLTHTQDPSLVSGTDLAEPIDYRTTTLAAGKGIYKKLRWLADLNYRFAFRNEFA